MIMKECNFIGCSQLIPKYKGSPSYCEKHDKYNKKWLNKNRKDDPKIYHTKRWQNLRKKKLNNNPICEMCEKNNRITMAVMVHHKTPVKENGDLAMDYDNLMSLCRQCHNEIHEKMKNT